jgi:hypothetical protein
MPISSAVAGTLGFGLERIAAGRKADLLPIEFLTPALYQVNDQAIRTGHAAKALPYRVLATVSSLARINEKRLMTSIN